MQLSLTIIYCIFLFQVLLTNDFIEEMLESVDELFDPDAACMNFLSSFTNKRI